MTSGWSWNRLIWDPVFLGVIRTSRLQKRNLERRYRRPPDRGARPPEARQGFAMAPTNTGEDAGPILTLQDALCMVSIVG